MNPSAWAAAVNSGMPQTLAYLATGEMTYSQTGPRNTSAVNKRYTTADQQASTADGAGDRFAEGNGNGANEKQKEAKLHVDPSSINRQIHSEDTSSGSLPFPPLLFCQPNGTKKKNRIQRMA